MSIRPPAGSPSGASGASSYWIGAESFLASGGGAVAVAQGNPARFPVWLLDATSVESVACSVSAEMFDGWATLDVDLVWYNQASGAGNVAWRLTHKTLDHDGGVSVSGTDLAIVTDTAGAINVTSKVALGTGIAVPALGQLMTLKITREAADVADTLGNDAGLIGVVLRQAA